MKLVLHNFRCWKDKTFIFPQNGLVLLHGDSGDGKSTIFQAFYWCLFESLKTVSTYGEKKTKVEIYNNNLYICRETNPKRLILKRDNDEYEQMEAQNIINNIYGKEFLNTSYITQKQTSSFFNLSGKHKMDLLESLAFQSDTQIENIKIKSNNYKKKTELELQTTLGELRLKERELTDFILPDKPELTFEDNEYDILIINKTKNVKDIERLKNDLVKIEKQVITNDFNITNVEEWNNEVVVLKNKIKKIDEYAEDISVYKQILEYKQLEIGIDQLQIELTNENNRYDELFEKEEDRKSIINDKLKLLKYTSKEELNKIKEKINKNNKYEELVLKIKKIKLQIINESEIKQLENELLTEYKCPKCNSKVCIDKDNLIISNKKSTLSQVEIKNKLESLKKDKKEYDKNKILKDNYENELKDLHFNIIDEDIDTLEKENKEYELLTRELKIDNTPNKNNIIKLEKKIQNIKEKIEEFEYDISDYTIDEIKDIIRNKKEVLELQKKVDEYEIKIKNIKIVSKDSLTNELLNIKKLVKEKTKQYNDLLEKEKDISIYRDYTRKIEQYNELENKVNNIRKSHLSLSDKLTSIELFIKKILESESKAVFDIISNLNVYINYFIQKFFNTAINVEIVPFKELKSGNIKPTIDILIGYKENEIDFSSLSGGEQDRLTLCTFLALNQVCGCDILFLDESISSIQSELTNDIVDVIKESVSNNKLVIMISHQCCCGMFDTVINVKN